MSQPPRFPGSQQWPTNPQWPSGPPNPPGGAQQGRDDPQHWGQSGPQTRHYPAVQGQQLPGDPGPSGTPPGKTPGKSKKIGLIIGASVLALILLITAVALTVTYQVRVNEQRAAEVARQAEAERQAELTRQESAVQGVGQGYLTALTESDAEKALSFAASEPHGNNTLLSRDVLVEANNRAALGQVSVGEAELTESTPGTWTEGTVKVSYSIGDQQQTADLPVHKVGTEWKVSQVATPVEFGLVGPERVINGVQVAPGDYNLFPGSYSMTSANPLISLDTSEFVLAAPTDSVADWSSTIALSEEGTNQSLEASKRAVDQCLQSRELSPPDCPFIHWAEGGLSIDKSTIRYTLKNDPWADVQWKFNPGTMTASTSVPIEHEIQARATRDGVRGSLIPQTQQRTAHIIVKVQDGTPQVTFS